jgi:benzoate membrane transport protein
MSLLRDSSASTLVAGAVAVLVGFTSSVAIVFQAAVAAGASESQVASWIWALGLGMGATSIGLSLWTRAPVLTAWSTPGAALLITATAGIPLAETIGAFVVCGLAIALAGFSGAFERALSRIPASLAAGLLAGVLLRFGFEVFVSMRAQPMMVGVMLLIYLAGRRWMPRYAVLASLAAGLTIAVSGGQIQAAQLQLAWAVPQFVMPQFSLAALVGVAAPLFIVTMASQNVPGVATLRACGYGEVPISPVVGVTGLATAVLAPFGGFALSLAAITAAICMGRDAHEDPRRRYAAAVAAGVFYVLVGVAGATVAALFAALPKELVLAIAGLALFGTIGAALAGALADEHEREPALVAFLVTASGVTVAGIGSAFWGLVAGVLAWLLLRARRRVTT